MTSLLVRALLLAFLLGRAAASSPGISMDPSLSPSPMGSFYPDPDGMLDAICELCGISINYCAHALVGWPAAQQHSNTLRALTDTTHRPTRNELLPLRKPPSSNTPNGRETRCQTWTSCQTTTWKKCNHNHNHNHNRNHPCTPAGSHRCAITSCASLTITLPGCSPKLYKFTSKEPTTSWTE